MGTRPESSKKAKQAQKGPLCPMCRTPLALADEPKPPFCSPRCMRVDLGRWLVGDYRVPSEEPVDPALISDE